MTPPLPVAEAARRRGWSYVAVDTSLAAHFRDLGGCEVREVVRGEHEGRRFLAFERRHSSSHLDPNSMVQMDSTSLSQIVTLDLGVAFPDFEVTPRNTLSRLLGHRGTVTTGHAGFDHANAIRSPSPEFADDVLPTLLSTLLAWPPVAWRFEGSSLVTVADGSLHVEHIDAMLSFATAVAAAIPPAVWKRLGGSATVG
ncbi:MAG: hypothetical protein QM621_09605 [Aeromicrobium sp.]|uniref:hypothetical protein n=1 Tax=Aeromicrobium sp. TaxID=1871063 RepID=UPI0039E36215